MTDDTEDEPHVFFQTTGVIFACNFFKNMSFDKRNVAEHADIDAFGSELIENLPKVSHLLYV